MRGPMAASMTVGASTPAPPMPSASADQMSPVKDTLRSVSAGRSTWRYSSMCLAGVANGIFSVPSMLDLWARPMPEDEPRSDGLLHREGLGGEHERVPRPGGDHRRADLDARGARAHEGDGRQGVGHRELGHPVGRQAVRLRLAGVVDELRQRRPRGDEAGAVDPDAHGRIMPRAPARRVLAGPGVVGGWGGPRFRGWTSTYPADIQATLDELDAFIAAEIAPLQAQDDNERFFDHRREYARTDFEHDGVPRADWEDLLREMRRRADAAGWLRLALPAEFGGRDASNLEMAIIREHLAHKGLGPVQRPAERELDRRQLPDGADDAGLRHRRPEGGVDARLPRRHPSPRLRPHRAQPRLRRHLPRDHGGAPTATSGCINGHKRFNSGLHHATHDIVFARTSGDPGSPVGISAFLVPCDAPGFSVDFFWWTFNMPTDHAEVTMTDVRVGADALFGRLDHGLELAQLFVHENRIRQAASSLGAAQYCIDEAVAYANGRTTWTKALSTNQGIQFPLVELHTEAAMLRQLIRMTAWQMDQQHHMELTHQVAMCNYRANRLACDAADRAMQTCGGVGYSRHMPFEHIYRHHRRYRITEGSEEIQMRKVAQHLFGFGRKPARQ